MKVILTTAMAILIAVSFAFKSENKMESTKKVGAVEIVIFSFNEDFSDQEAVAKANLVNNFLSKQKGFISRTTSKLDENKWIDLVYWESMKEAKAASEAAMKCEPCGAFFSTISEQSMQFMHGETFVNVH